MIPVIHSSGKSGNHATLALILSLTAFHIQLIINNRNMLYDLSEKISSLTARKDSDCNEFQERE